jgi:hypothetical protein
MEVPSQKDITLYQGDGTAKNIILRALPTVAITLTTIFLYAGDATPKNIIMSDPTVVRPYTPPPVGGLNRLLLLHVG